ncbi:hypothetical protein NP493_866g01081 [Ridgeia piscesae]|uniref:Nascent polypeptide-associated complex subunit alpha-like UBA domain-containing protein n=1 Tax=Ridgeia piscesae TaxID=27915 RepID=A0AAD9KLJ9_RIDPI|nr:hypothetical protein NP493_866g01081 [Ridgeia piscesae]
MAKEVDVGEIEEVSDEPKGKKAAKHDDGAADLEKVTDYVEEAEISSQDISVAMKVVNDRMQQEANAKLQKEKELSRVKISKEDVDLIVNEMEIPRSAAERKLREHKGDLVEALIDLTN